MTRYIAVLTLLLAFACPAFARGGHGYGHRSTKSHKVKTYKPHKPRKHKWF